MRTGQTAGLLRNVQHDTHDLSLLLLFILELVYYAIYTAKALHACFTFGSVHPNA